jgi:hypothetical protein
VEWPPRRLLEVREPDQVLGQELDHRKWPVRLDWAVYSLEECQNLNLRDLDQLRPAMGTLEARIVTLLRRHQNLRPLHEPLCLPLRPLPRGRMFQYLHLPFGPVGLAQTFY